MAYTWNPGFENDGTLIGQGWYDEWGNKYSGTGTPEGVTVDYTSLASGTPLPQDLYQQALLSAREKVGEIIRQAGGNTELAIQGILQVFPNQRQAFALMDEFVQYGMLDGSYQLPGGQTLKVAAQEATDSGSSWERFSQNFLPYAGAFILGGMGLNALGAQGLAGVGAAEGVGAYGGMDAGAVAGADYGAGALGAGGFEYGMGAGPITNAADQVAYGGIPGEVGATMPAAQAMAPGAVAGAQMGGALPELGIAGDAASGLGMGAGLGAGMAAGNALGGFDWGSLPQNAAGLLQGMDWLGLGSDLLGLEAQRDYQKDLINTMNRAIDYSDPAFAQRGQYQQQFANMQTDPNWMQNDQLLQNMMNQSLRNVSAQNSAQGYMGSGNILHDLTRTANETIAPYGLQRMQQIGEAGGILGGRQNASQAIGSLGQAAGQAGIGQAQSIQSMMGRLPRQQVNTGINNTLGGLFGTF